MKKGVVLSVNKFSITLLTPDGEFEKCRRLQRNYEIGEEITYQSQENVWKSFFSYSGKKAAVMSAAVACVMILSIVIPNFSTQVSAYMTIDVNPSIELGVDDDLQVVELRGLNADGKRVISQIPEWKNEDLSDIAEQIIHKTEELGYFTDSTRKIIISKTVIEDEKPIKKQLSQEIKDFKKDIPANTEMIILPATEKDRNQAEQQGISTGKYLEQKLDKSHVKQKLEHDRPENKVTKKEQVEKNNKNTDHEPIKVKDTNKIQPEKNSSNEKEKTASNTNIPTNPGNKEQSEIKRNSQNQKNAVTKSNQGNSIKSETKSDKGKSEAKVSKVTSGNKGNLENKGNLGKKNNTGNAGNSGKKDKSGNNGNVGNKGNKGNSGNNGNAGNKGNSGNNGNAGNKGNSGNKGNAGNKGNSGNKGNAGNNGNTGNKGNSGKHGNSGNKGNSGNHENAGNNGNSNK